MTRCEICGKEVSDSYTIKVEGAELSSCEDCSGIGEIIDEPDTPDKQEEFTRIEEETQVSTDEPVFDTREELDPEEYDGFGQEDVKELVVNYDERIRKGREEKGMSRKELADLINEKESVIKRLENLNALPNEVVRKKLEKALDINLLETGGVAT